ncbi:MAG: class I tRNA ligase family protein, partial [Verrucomicrobiae bacterium]|nr:class I tRNA ligase family protein [Verrucomicrobiae bacterium]
FWVARMIIAGFRWEDRLPFRNVFFTSIIRDKQGRKLSKSLGNSPDPLDLIDKFGADGVRFGLMRIAPAGTDVRYDEDQIVEGRNFANKLWNAVRFRQMQGAAEADKGPLSLFAIDILAKLEALEADMDEALKEYRFNDAGNLLYQFFWNEYCDWYLESAKGDFAPEADPAAKAATLWTMDTVLRRFLLQLHPYMPHITEELWEKMGFRAEGGPEFLMQTTLDNSLVMHDIPAETIAAAQAKVAAIYGAVGRARNLKAEYGLAANRGVKFIIDPEASEQGQIDESTVFGRLAGAGDVTVVTGYDPGKGVPVALTAIGKIYMPLEGLIDVAAERERLTKELGKAEDELRKVNAKLSNENFVSRAAPEIVAEHRERQGQWKARVEELGRMIENLGGA